MYQNYRLNPKEPEINTFKTRPLENRPQQNMSQFFQQPPEATLNPELITAHYEQMQYYNYVQYIQQMKQATANHFQPPQFEFYKSPSASSVVSRVEGLPPGRPEGSKPKLSRSGTTYGQYKTQTDPLYIPPSTSFSDVPRKTIDDGWGDDDGQSQPKKAKTGGDDGWSDDEGKGSFSSGFGNSTSREGSWSRGDRGRGGSGSSRGGYRGGRDGYQREERQPRDDDWKCGKCDFNRNFGSRLDCYKCQEPRGDAPTTTAKNYSRNEYRTESRGSRGGYRGGRGGGGGSFRSHDAKPVSSGWSDDEGDKKDDEVRKSVMQLCDDDWDAPAKEKKPTDDGDDWGEPAEKKKKPSDDDDDWGEPAKKKKKPSDDGDDWGEPAKKKKKPSDDGDDWGANEKPQKKEASGEKVSSDDIEDKKDKKADDDDDWAELAKPLATIKKEKKAPKAEAKVEKPTRDVKESDADGLWDDNGNQNNGNEEFGVFKVPSILKKKKKEKSDKKEKAEKKTSKKDKAKVVKFADDVVGDSAGAVEPKTKKEAGVVKPKAKKESSAAKEKAPAATASQAPKDDEDWNLPGEPPKVVEKSAANDDDDWNF